MAIAEPQVAAAAVASSRALSERKLPATDAAIRGRALSMLRMPPVATAPAPMYRT